MSSGEGADGACCGAEASADYCTCLDCTSSSDRVHAYKEGWVCAAGTWVNPMFVRLLGAGAASCSASVVHAGFLLLC